MNRTRTAPATLLIFTCLLGPAVAGETMHALSSPVNPNLLTVDSSTGSVLSSISVTGEQALFGGLTFTPDNTALYSIDGYNDGISDRTFRIDPTSAVGVVVGDTGFNWNFRSVEFDPTSGVLYATRDNELFTLDLVTGAATSVASITGSTLDQATALAIDYAGNAYMTDIGDRGLFSLDLSSGNLTHLGNLITPPSWFQDLAFDSTGALWGAGGSGGVYKIDIAAVSATLAFSSPGYGGITFLRGPAPEPGVGYCSGDGVAPHTLCPCGNNNSGGSGGCDWGNPAFPGGGALNATGSASMAANDTYLMATGVDNDFGVFFGAANQVNGGNGNPLNDGLRCAGGSLVRLIPPTMAAGNQAITPLPVQQLDTAAGGGVTRRYQYWFRSPGGPCGQMANLTNGYEIAWLP